MTPQDAQPSRHVTTLVTRKSTLAMAWHHVCLEICKHMADTVLVVDDELELVAGCERLLQRLGHVSLRAHTGPEAMALIDRKKPDLVVADLRLPGADGLAVTRHARAHVPPIPVILITAYDPGRHGERRARVGSMSTSPIRFQMRRSSTPWREFCLRSLSTG